MLDKPYRVGEWLAIHLWRRAMVCVGFCSGSNIGNYIGFPGQTMAKNRARNGTSLEDRVALANGEQDSVRSDGERDEEARIAESRLSLAKQYLERLARKARQGTEAEADREAIAAQLRQDLLAEQGKTFDRLAASVAAGPVERYSRLDGVPTCLVLADGKIFVGTKDGLISQYEDKKRVHVYRRETRNTVLCLGANEQYLASGHRDGKVVLYRRDRHALVRVFDQHRGPVNGLVFTAEHLFAASDDKTIRQWDLGTLGFVDTLYGHQEGILGLDAVGTKDQLASVGGRDRTARLWQISEENQLVFRAADDVLECIRSLDEEHFVTGSESGTLALWNRRRKKAVHAVERAHDGPIVSLVTKRCSDLLVTGSNDGLVKVWKVDLEKRTLQMVAGMPVPGFINALGLTNAGTLVIAVGREHRLGRWQVLDSAKNALLAVQLW